MRWSIGLLLVAPPVGAGHPHELEVAEAAGVGHVGAAAQVDEARRVLVGADRCPASVTDVGSSAAPSMISQLVRVVLEERRAPRSSGSSSRTKAGLGDDLAHPGLDALEVVGGERAAVGQLEVVVEAVLDRRADAERGAREQVEHGLGQHVGRRVADRVEAPLAGASVTIATVGAVGSGVDEVALDAVDVGDHRRLGQPRPIDAARSAAVAPVGQLALGTVRERDRDLGHGRRAYRRPSATPERGSRSRSRPA